jgi:hypothetical protein
MGWGDLQPAVPRIAGNNKTAQIEKEKTGEEPGAVRPGVEGEKKARISRLFFVLIF